MRRNHWRRVVAALTGAALGASALAASTSPVHAASPTAAAGTLVVAGEAECATAGPPATDCNPWRFGSGPHYQKLREMLTDPTNFSKTQGKFQKGNFTLKTVGNIATPGALADVDIFVAAIPIGGGTYDGPRLAALQAFINGGGAVVLLNNNVGFGETANWLGYTLRPNRAFFGKDSGGISDCGLPYTGEKAPEGSVTVAPGQAGHAVTGGSIFGFGVSGEPTVHHTVNIITGAPATATSLYNLGVAGQAATIALNGPRGFVTPVPPATSSPATDLVVTTGATISLKPAVTTPSNIVGGLGGISYQEVTAGGTPIGAAQVGNPTFTGLTAGDHYYRATITRAAPIGGTQTSNTIKVTAKAVTGPGDATNLVNGDGNDDHCPGSNDTIDNNIAGSLMSVIPKGTYSPTAGPIVVISDLDVFSNAYDTEAGDFKIRNNSKLAMNTFAWLMNQLILDAPPPPPPPPGSTDTYFNLPAPTRVYDSRTAGGGPLGNAETRNIKVRNVGGVPADAKSIIANVTAIDATAGGYFTVWPAGDAQPTASTHNFPARQNFANMVVVPVGTADSISVFNSAGSTGVLVDIVGYTKTAEDGGRLRTIAPDRILDTRSNIGLNGVFGPGATRDLVVRDGIKVPAGATAAVLNMTVVDPSQTGSFLTVWGAGQGRPNVSNINMIANINRPNLVVAPIGADGKISIYNDSGTTHVLGDLVGYLVPGGTGGYITGRTSARILDTRPGNQFDGDEGRLLQIHSNGIPNGAKTVILKVTVDQPSNNGGFLTVWPEGNRPVVSNLNFNAGMTVPNIVVTRIGADGSIRIHNAIGSTHVIVDLLGFAD